MRQDKFLLRVCAELTLMPSVEARLQQILHYASSEPELLVDMKTGGTAIDSTSFDEFWDLVQQQVDKYGTAVHSRRHEGAADNFVVAVAADEPPPSNPCAASR